MSAMAIRYPAPLKPGDRIGITSPSSGVGEQHRGRFDFVVAWLEQRGFEVVVGGCMDGSTHVSAPAADRAGELTDLLLDASIRVVIPPWGGETAIDLVEILDWERIGAAEPTWFVGFSDISTLLTPLTLLTGVATLHGNNLMDTPYRVPSPLRSWLDLATLAPRSAFIQSSPGVHRVGTWDDWTAHPDVTEHEFNGTGAWVRLDGAGEVNITGRMIGGCIETMCNLAGTPFGNVARFAREHAPEGLLVYVEAAEDDAATICRNLHGMRLAGFFEGARAVIVGRTSAPDAPTLTQHEAVMDALGRLGVPIVADVECGHVPPHLPIVNGALGRLRLGADGGTLEQILA